MRARVTPPPLALAGLALAALAGPRTGQCSTAKLDAGPLASGALFGAALAVDGATYANGPFGGAAYVFRRQTEDLWVQTAKLAGTGAGGGQGQFGASVSIRGERIAVGDPLNASAGPAGGMIHVFEFVGATWTGTPMIAGVVGEHNCLGQDVALYDGGVLASAPGDGGGAVYSFEFAVPGSLIGCPAALLLAAGGTQHLALAAGD
jgi:hypothetical protein